MMFRILLVIMALGMAPASAQVSFAEHETFQTRFGYIDIQQNEWDQTLRLDGQPIAAITDYRVVVAGAWGTADPAIDWVLIQLNHSGNMCPYYNILMRLSAGQATVSEPFGECSGAPVDLRVLGDRVEVDISHPALATDREVISYDGTALTRTLIPAALGGGDPAASDPLQWVGQHPLYPLHDPAEQARFLRVLTPEQLQQLADRLGPAQMVEQRGNWVLGRGCRAHACNVLGGVWGIRLSDGLAVAAFVDSGQSPTVFGNPGGDPVFAGFLAEAQAGVE